MPARPLADETLHLIAAVRDALAERLGADATVEERKLFGCHAFMVDGKLCLAVKGEDLLVRLAASKLDAGARDATTYCAMAKRFATDAGFTVVNEALQLHGGYGYIREYPLERLLRDARVHQILEGTNEIMRVIIARRMLDGDAPEAIR